MLSHKVWPTYASFFKYDQALQSDSRIFLKLLLYPFVCTYTCKCAMNIIEKYEYGMAVG